jgi:3-deoxy-D-manno-octulosonic acid (KDO) 8-phosphate synthase
MMRHVKAGNVTFGNDLPLVFICGPCQIESRAHALETAAALKEIAASAGVPLIYKSSFDKANRTSVSAARGIGMAEGLAILAEVREATGCERMRLSWASVAAALAGARIFSETKRTARRARELSTRTLT